MAEFDAKDGTDAADATKKANEIRLEFDRADIKAWLVRLEVRLEFAGCNSQWLKRVSLENMLPNDIAACCKDLFGLGKSEIPTGNLIYKLCKERILKVHGPRPEDDFGKAQAMVLNGLPSDAAKRIRALVCQKKPAMTSCCCHVAVGKLWRDLLPAHVKAAVANMTLATEAEFTAITDAADNVFLAVQPTAAAAALALQPSASAPPSMDVAAVAVTSAVGDAAAALQAALPADLDTSADAPAFSAVNQLAVQLAAFNKHFGKKPQAQQQRPPPPRRGQGQDTRQQTRRGPPHPDGPSATCCNNHWKYGRNAFTCADKARCPWKNLPRNRHNRD